MRKRIWRFLIVFGVMAVLCGGICTYWSMLPEEPLGIKRFPKTHMIDVGPKRGDWEKTVYEYLHLVELESGEIVVPILSVVRPNFRGFMGAVRQDPVWESGMGYVSEKEARMAIPIDDRIERHLIVIRPVVVRDEKIDQPWRIWAVGGNDFRNVQNAVFPEYTTLELFDKRADKDAILAKQDEAKKYVNKLSDYGRITLWSW